MSYEEKNLEIGFSETPSSARASQLGIQDCAAEEPECPEIDSKK
jgi:hypothetical protein